MMPKTTPDALIDTAEDQAKKPEAPATPSAYLENLHFQIALSAMNGILASGCDRGPVPIANMAFDMATAMIEKAFNAKVIKAEPPKS